jgi:hypothetical protein
MLEYFKEIPTCRPAVRSASLLGRGRPSTFSSMSSRDQDARFRLYGSAFLYGAISAINPFATLEVPQVNLRDPREDALRLAGDARRVAEDFARATRSSAPNRRGA